MAFFRKDIGSTLFGCKLFKEKKSRNADAKRLKICDIFTESSFKRFFKLLITLFFPNTHEEKDVKDVKRSLRKWRSRYANSPLLYYLVPIIWHSTPPSFLSLIEI